MVDKLRYDIPRYIGDDETIDLPNGLRARIRLEHDSSRGAPWEECDGHGPVSDWTTREKKPGERVLYEDRGRKLYYDYAAAIRIAKRDGWDAPPYKTGTKGERAARAVEEDFKFLQGWCRDEWHYVGVCVTILGADGDELGSGSIWGVESNGDYWREVACDCIDEALHYARAELQRAEVYRCFC